MGWVGVEHGGEQGWKESVRREGGQEAGHRWGERFINSSFQH